MYPKLTIDPIGSAIRVLIDFKNRHMGIAATQLRCGPESYQNLMAVGFSFLDIRPNGDRYLAGARIVMDPKITGYLAERPVT